MGQTPTHVSLDVTAHVEARGYNKLDGGWDMGER